MLVFSVTRPEGVEALRPMAASLVAEFPSLVRGRAAEEGVWECWRHRLQRVARSGRDAEGGL
jgi:hypothetical protein